MKRAGLLLVATGCNAIFGIKPALLFDASPDGQYDAPYFSMMLTRQVLEDTSGTIDYPAIAGASVQAGPIDPATGALRPLAIGADGTFLVPLDLAAGAYRLIYQVDTDVPTEVHSAPNGAHFTVPQFGRVARTPPPMFSLLEFDPINKVGDYTDPRVFTTGMWTSYDFASAEGGPSRQYGYQQNAQSLSGSLGTLLGADGDLEVLVDCTSGEASGFAVMSVDHLNDSGGGPATAPSTWTTAPIASVAWSAPPSGNGGPVSRMTGALGGNYIGGTYVSRAWGGAIPTDKMPNFIQPNPGGLDGLAMFGLATTFALPHTFVNPFNGTNAPMLPLVAMAEDSSTRTVGGVTLTSGFQQVSAQQTQAVALDYPVGIAHATGDDVTLAPHGDPAHAVVLTNVDGKVITLGGASLAELTFDTDQPVDDCLATLYTLGASSLTPVRHFLLLQPPLAGSPFVFDASLLDGTHTYVFGIVCRKGFGDAAHADYTQVATPFSFTTSTMYSSTFTVTP